MTTDEAVCQITALLDIADKPDEEKVEEDWEAEGSARERIAQVFRLHRYEEDGDLRVGVTECGSHGSDDTPRVLYRLLFLFAEQGGRWTPGTIALRPGHRPWPVDFGDMYKSCSLFAIVSPDGQFVADPQFYKYQLSLTFRASKGHVTGHRHSVICGVPGSDNGVQPVTDSLRAWQALLIRLLTREWDVYSGNNFRV